MKIAIGCDHAAFIEKQKILEFLKELGHTVIDLGTHNSESVNYPKYGHNVAKMVVQNEVDKGIVICGSGIGISIAANKIKGVMNECTFGYKQRSHSSKLTPTLT